MHEYLLDTSFTIYHPSIPSQSFTNLFHTSVSESDLRKYSQRLTRYMTALAPPQIDDFSNEIERTGSFVECRWRSLQISKPPPPQAAQSTTAAATTTTSAAATTQSNSITAVQVIYQKQTYTFILLSSHLILSKAPQLQTKHFFDFLTETFNVTFDQSKFPSSLLQSILATYITTLVSSYINTPDENDQRRNENNNDDDTELNNMHRLAILKSAITNLKLTISFSAPVAPKLKSIDIDIPHETIDTLLSITPGNPTRTPSPTENTNIGQTFLRNLQHHITEHTGLKLPLVDLRSSSFSSTSNSADHRQSTFDESLSGSQSSPVLKLTKLSTSSFAMNTEGKIKFSSKAIENAADAAAAAAVDGRENLVISADLKVLREIVEFLSPDHED